MEKCNHFSIRRVNCSSLKKKEHLFLSKYNSFLNVKTYNIPPLSMPEGKLSSYSCHLLIKTFLYIDRSILILQDEKMLLKNRSMFCTQYYRGGQKYLNKITNKTGVINDPLGQPTVPGRQWLSLDFEVLCRTDGRTDGRTTCVKIVITTGWDCGRPRGSIWPMSTRHCEANGLHYHGQWGSH